MRITDTNSDRTILKAIGERLAQIRLNRNLTQAELSEESGVSKRTVERLESGESIQSAGLIRIFRALGLLSRLEILLPEPTPSPLAQLKLRGASRRRASSKKSARKQTGDWKWGDEE